MDYRNVEPEYPEEELEIQSTFIVLEENVVDIHLTNEAYLNEIYDIEILPEVQEPRWKGVDVIELPPKWVWTSIKNGARLYSNTPIPTGEPFTIKIKIYAEKISDSIIIYATDENHKILGIVTSTRQ